MRYALLIALAFAPAVARADGDVAGLLGEAQRSRWSGRPLAARALAMRAVELAPDQPAAREELAWADADLGLWRAARAALGDRDDAASPQLRARLAELRAPRAVLSGAGSQDSNGIDRLTGRAVVQLSTPWDLRLRAGGGLIHLEQQATAVDYRVAALALGFSLPHVELAGGGGVYLGEGTALPDGHLALAVRPLDGVRLALGARHRPFIETAEPLATDLTAYYSAGAGGAIDLGAAGELQADEATVSVQLGPTPWSYLYGDGRGLRAGDGNRGYAVAAGLGIDLVGLFVRAAPVSLFARWDAYLCGYAEARPAYFSPSSFDAQAVGGEAQLRLRFGLTLAAAGGGTFAFAGGVSPGWFAGGGLDLRRGPVLLALRGERRDDLYFRSRRAWLAFELRL